jgi:hypothetical protein
VVLRNVGVLQHYTESPPRGLRLELRMLIVGGGDVVYFETT